MVVNHGLLSKTVGRLAEIKLAAAITWVPRANARQFVAFIVDDSTLDSRDLTILLSQDEKNITASLKEPVEVRHFVMRRSFQRSFMQKVTGWQGPLSQIPMHHSRDERAACALVPQLSLSFSSSGNIAMAAATHQRQTGIDIERLRAIDNAEALSTRFFNPLESAYLHSLVKQQQGLEFLRFWTIKEACLKAMGKGIVHGLETFVVSVNAEDYSINPPIGFGRPENWSIELIEVSSAHVAALACFESVPG